MVFLLDESLSVTWLVSVASICVFVSRRVHMHKPRDTALEVMLWNHPHGLCAVSSFFQYGDRFASSNAWALISSPYWPVGDMCATGGWGQWWNGPLKERSWQGHMGKALDLSFLEQCSNQEASQPQISINRHTPILRWNRLTIIGPLFSKWMLTHYQVSKQLFKSLECTRFLFFCY